MQEYRKLQKLKEDDQKTEWEGGTNTFGREHNRAVGSTYKDYQQPSTPVRNYAKALVRGGEEAGEEWQDDFEESDPPVDFVASMINYVGEALQFIDKYFDPRWLDKNHRRLSSHKRNEGMMEEKYSLGRELLIKEAPTGYGIPVNVGDEMYGSAAWVLSKGGGDKWGAAEAVGQQMKYESTWTEDKCDNIMYGLLTILHSLCDSYMYVKEGEMGELSRKYFRSLVKKLGLDWEDGEWARSMDTAHMTTEEQEKIIKKIKEKKD